MATLVNGVSGARFVLRAEYTVGRSRSCDLHISAPEVSAHHASFLWTGDHWELRDLGSRNGSSVDGAPIPRGAAIALSAGAAVCFGSPAQAWTVADVAPPLASAVRVGGDAEILARGGVLCLPDDERPELSVSVNADGLWIAEDAAGSVRYVADLEVVPTAAGLWTLHLPTGTEGTVERGQARAGAPSVVKLGFRVSEDEEYVEIAMTVVQDGDSRVVDVKARAHHYLLLLLARARLAERPTSSATEEGWVLQDRLERMIRMDARALYVAIHRARRQFAEAGLPESVPLVERRVGTGQLRLGVAELDIQRM